MSLLAAIARRYSPILLKMNSSRQLHDKNTDCILSRWQYINWFDTTGRKNWPYIIATDLAIEHRSCSLSCVAQFHGSFNISLCFYIFVNDEIVSKKKVQKVRIVRRQLVVISLIELRTTDFSLLAAPVKKHQPMSMTQIALNVYSNMVTWICGIREAWHWELWHLATAVTRPLILDHWD